MGLFSSGQLSSDKTKKAIQQFPAMEDNYEKQLKKLIRKNESNIIENQLVSMLAGTSDSDFDAALIFLIVLIETKLEDAKIDSAIDYLIQKTDILKILDAIIPEGNFFRRSHFIYTLPNLWHFYQDDESMKYLKILSERDPINLAPFVSNLALRQHGKISWDILDQIINSKDPLVRWSFLGIHRSIRLDPEKADQVLSRFREDENSYIREETEYLLTLRSMEETAIKRGQMEFNEEEEEKLARIHPAWENIHLPYVLSTLLEDEDRIDYTREDLPLIIGLEV
jgi:hypothetical protein